MYRTITRYYIYVLSASLLLPFLLSPIFSQSVPKGGLTGKVYNISFRQKPFHEALGEFAFKNHIPIGVQSTDELENAVCAAPFDLEMHDVSIDEIMTAVMVHCPVYAWSIKDNVINVQPAVPEASLLDVHITFLSAENKTTDEILESVIRSREMKSEMRSHDLKRDTSRIFPRNTVVEERYSVQLKDNSVRDILNYLLISTKSRYWVYYRLNASKNFFSVRVL